MRYIATLLEWFPEARILVMLRDPRAVVASQLGTPYVQGGITDHSLRNGHFVSSRMEQIIHYADNWSKIFEDLLPRWSNDSRVAVFSYEALTQHPERETRSMCEFLGERHEENMLSGREAGSVPMPAGTTPSANLERWRREHDAKSLRPVSKDSLDKWRQSLSDLELKVVEARCMSGMRKRGYPPSVSTARRLEGRVFAQAFLTAAKSEAKARALFKSIRSRVPSRGFET